jgi:hypothetical protein
MAVAAWVAEAAWVAVAADPQLLLGHQDACPCRARRRRADGSPARSSLAAVAPGPCTRCIAVCEREPPSNLVGFRPPQAHQMGVPYGGAGAVNGPAGTPPQPPTPNPGSPRAHPRVASASRAHTLQTQMDTTSLEPRYTL